MKRAVKRGFTIVLMAAAVLFIGSISSAEDMEGRSDSIAKKNIKLLKDKQYEHEARLALVALGKKAVPYLAEEAEDPSEKISHRIAVIDILGDIKSPDAADSLLATLKDSNAKIRRSSAKALGGIRDNKSIAGLKDALSDFDA